MGRAVVAASSPFAVHCWAQGKTVHQPAGAEETWPSPLLRCCFTRKSVCRQVDKSHPHGLILAGGFCKQSRECEVLWYRDTLHACETRPRKAYPEITCTTVALFRFCAYITVYQALITFMILIEIVLQRRCGLHR